MNLPLVHTLLAAAEEQPYGFLKVRGSELVREVELMNAAGLVVATVGDNAGEAVAVINRITDSGNAFLRAFKNQPPPKISELASTEN
jgi:hypothetical protein